VHPCPFADDASREGVDAGCRKLTASWVRERAVSDGSVDLCDFFEGHEKAGAEALLPPGVS
jgi:DNA excision repair protein ERCC-2